MKLARADARIEIISMDSALVYRGMDIGSAKPSEDEQREVRHHLIDIIDPSESYSAARFVADATKAAAEIRSRGKIPLMVGGTMLYLKAYREGLHDLPSAPKEIRDSLALEARKVGWPAMHEKLAQIDRETAARLKTTDAQRISRALEVYFFTGKTLSQLILESAPRQTPGTGHREALDVIALEPIDRKKLHAKIEERFLQMLSLGFVDEVHRLKARGDLNRNMPSMRCVGYRQAWDFLDGNISKDEFIAAAVAATRQLAKRQLTWIRSFENIERMDPFDQTTMVAASSALRARISPTR